MRVFPSCLCSSVTFSVAPVETFLLRYVVQPFCCQRKRKRAGDFFNFFFNFNHLCGFGAHDVRGVVFSIDAAQSRSRPKKRCCWRGSLRCAPSDQLQDFFVTSHGLTSWWRTKWRGNYSTSNSKVFPHPRSRIILTCIRRRNPQLCTFTRHDHPYGRPLHRNAQCFLHCAHHWCCTT